MKTEFQKLEQRVTELEDIVTRLCYAPNHQQPDLSDVRIESIVEKVGEALINKAWSERNCEESIRQAYAIAGVFKQEWQDKTNHADLQFLVLNVGKRLAIDYMPSYTAIQDWIKASEVVSLQDACLIGKSAAIILAKRSASQHLVRYVISAAENDDNFSMEKIKTLIDREKHHENP